MTKALREKDAAKKARPASPGPRKKDAAASSGKDPSPTQDKTAGSPRDRIDSGDADENKEPSESPSGSDSDEEDMKSEASGATEVDVRRKSILTKTPKQKLYSARIKIMAVRAFIDTKEGLDMRLAYGNREKMDHDARELKYTEGVDGANDLMRGWGEYRRSSFALNPGGSIYGAKNPVSWEDLGSGVPFLEVGPDAIMQSIRDAVEETVGRRLPYDWSFPPRPTPVEVDAGAQPDLMDDAAYMRFKGISATSLGSDSVDVDDPAMINKTLIAQFQEAHFEVEEDEEDDLEHHIGLTKQNTLAHM